MGVRFPVSLSKNPYHQANLVYNNRSKPPAEVAEW